jgi:para-nitrobenzyl esterase
MTFALSGYKWAGLQSQTGKMPVYVYYFQRKLPATPDFVKYGAFHTGEVAYALDNLKFLNRPWEPADKDLANLMAGYWANFIKTGNPNAQGLPKWPKYNTATKPGMVFDQTSTSAPLPDWDELDFILKRGEK